MICNILAQNYSVASHHTCYKLQGPFLVLTCPAKSDPSDHDGFLPFAHTPAVILAFLLLLKQAEQVPCIYSVQNTLIVPSFYSSFSLKIPFQKMKYFSYQHISNRCPLWSASPSSGYFSSKNTYVFIGFIFPCFFSPILATRL